MAKAKLESEKFIKASITITPEQKSWLQTTRTNLSQEVRILIDDLMLSEKVLQEA